VRLMIPSLIFYLVVAGSAAAPRKGDDAVAHNERGMDLYKKGNLDGAITEYREALRLKPDFPDAHDNLGAALGDKGNLDGAIAEYREVFRLKPDYPRMRSILTELLAKKAARESKH
jgi:Flp pilus assembly protein TadD